MNQGLGAQVVGVLMIGVTGVLVVGAIFQLNKPQGTIVPNASSVATTTVNDLFK